MSPKNETPSTSLSLDHKVISTQLLFTHSFQETQRPINDKILTTPKIRIPKVR